LEEEKWTKVMKFLRANPNLILKLIPTTMTVDEQGVAELESKSKILNKDIQKVQKTLRIKSSHRKKRSIKSIYLQMKFRETKKRCPS
jgi:hypothetical protein